VDELAEILGRAVGSRMEADVPLGAVLSGGIDSSAVVSMMVGRSSRPVQTFTIGFSEPAYDESPHAKAVATHLGTDHHELIVTPEDAREIIPLLPTMYDEPFADSSQIPTFLLSRMARRNVTVALSGDGGDELFGGYDRYRHLDRIRRMHRRVPSPARRLVAAGLADRSGLTDALGGSLGLVAVVVLVVAWRSPLVDVRRIVRQSLPVLVAAGLLDLIAGVTVERRLDDLLAAEAMLVLLPAFLGTAGALGGILSSRLSTQFHLGLDDATPLPTRSSLREFRSLALLALPVFACCAVIAQWASVATGQTTPGLGDLLTVVMIAGLVATVLVVVVAYYTTMAAYRFGLDPDTYGIPVVMSSLDLVGASTLILAMVAVGVA